MESVENRAHYSEGFDLGDPGQMDYLLDLGGVMVVALALRYSMALQIGVAEGSESHHFELPSLDFGDFRLAEILEYFVACQNEAVDLGCFDVLPFEAVDQDCFGAGDLSLPEILQIDLDSFAVLQIVG